VQGYEDVSVAVLLNITGYLISAPFTAAAAVATTTTTDSIIATIATATPLP
jgi:hypothetical protein